MERDHAGQLARLDTLDDYKVADGDTDVRGWNVVGPDGTLIGQVKHLIADPGARRVRYLEVELDAGVQAGAAGEHVLVATDETTLDNSRSQVVVRLAAALADAAAGGATGPARPARTDGEVRVVLMREELVVTKRLVAKEEVVVRKRVVTEARVIEADLRRERLVVDERTTQRTTQPPA